MSRSILSASFLALLSIAVLGCGPVTSTDGATSAALADSAVVRPLGRFWAAAGDVAYSFMTFDADHTFDRTDAVGDEWTGPYHFSKSGDSRFILLYDDSGTTDPVGGLLERDEYTYDGRLLKLRVTSGTEWITLARFLEKGEACTSSAYDECDDATTPLECKHSTSGSGAATCEPR
jgi:hypothetical protein